MILIDLEAERIKRKEESNDAGDWSVLDCLKYAVEKVESGEYPATMAYVALSWVDGDDGISRAYVAATPSRMATLGLLTQHVHDRAANK